MEVDQKEMEVRKENNVAKERNPDYSELLKSLYYTPKQPGSFGGVEALFRAARNNPEGEGITRDKIRKWFESQPTYTLHKPARIRFKRNVIMVHGIDEQFQADLVDMSMLAQWNDGVHFWLTCIDVLSKYAWVIPLRNKSARTVMAAFEEIFKERKPLKLQTDQGTEFTNALLYNFMKENNVHHFFAWNPDIKASIVERFNRTIKTRVSKNLTFEETYRYIDKLPDAVHSYNNSYHSSIKMTPAEASQPENEKMAWRNLYKERLVKRAHRRKHPKFKYRVGDYVRLSEERGVFRKGYKQRWTKEIFRVVKQSPRDPVVYRLEDLSGEPVIGSFYELEIQKVSKPESDVIEAAHKLKQEQQKRNRTSRERNLEFYIKFRGYPDYKKINQTDTSVSRNGDKDTIRITPQVELEK